MKNILYLTIACLFLWSCDDFELENQGINLQELPAYVAFDAPGDDAVMADIEAAEDDDPVGITVEAPTGTLTDINVDFTFEGTAVFGTDFTVDNASASGGSVVIQLDPSNVNNFDNADIVVTPLTDGVADGEKTLTITLTGATGTDGRTFAVGRGGTDFLKSATVVIADID